jgi:hypothetical protein
MGLVVSETKQNIFLWNNNQFFIELTYEQAVGTLSLYRYFPGLLHLLVKKEMEGVVSEHKLKNMCKFHICE